jgi:hypothetical protein
MPRCSACRCRATAPSIVAVALGHPVLSMLYHLTEPPLSFESELDSGLKPKLYQSLAKSLLSIFENNLGIKI